MERVVIQFQTPQDLAIFRTYAKEQIIKTNVADLSVLCDCSREAIAIAITKYGATVKSLQESDRNIKSD